MADDKLTITSIILNLLSGAAGAILATYWTIRQKNKEDKENIRLSREILIMYLENTIIEGLTRYMEYTKLAYNQVKNYPNIDYTQTYDELPFLNSNLLRQYELKELYKIMPNKVLITQFEDLCYAIDYFKTFMPFPIIKSFAELHIQKKKTHSADVEAERKKEKDRLFEFITMSGDRIARVRSIVKYLEQTN